MPGQEPGGRMTDSAVGEHAMADDAATIAALQAELRRLRARAPVPSPARTRSRMTERRGFHTVIVDGGTAGCVLANRLSERPDRSVALIEAGPDFGPAAGGDWPPELA